MYMRYYSAGYTFSQQRVSTSKLDSAGVQPLPPNKLDTAKGTHVTTPTQQLDTAEGPHAATPTQQIIWYTAEGPHAGTPTQQISDTAGGIL